MFASNNTAIHLIVVMKFKNIKHSKTTNVNLIVALKKSIN